MSRASSWDRRLFSSIVFDKRWMARNWQEEVLEIEFWITGNGDSDDANDQDADREGGLATATAKPKHKRPPMFKVILLNDDYTPMEFVVHVLEVFFSMDREKATQIMLAVHTQGAAVVGIFPRDIAETKMEQVNQYAQENEHPLVSTIEMTD